MRERMVRRELERNLMLMKRECIVVRHTWNAVNKLVKE